MRSHVLLPLAIALSAGAAAAQQINVSVGTGWVVTPSSNQVFNTFSTSNGVNGFMAGGVSDDHGTSVTSSYTRATATAQGYIIAGPAVSDGRTGSTSGTEFYSKAGGGNVAATLSAQPEQAVNNLRGVGYSGQTTASVSVSCSLFGPLTATCISRAVQPPAWPILATVPVSASASASGQTSFSITMSASSSANGTVTNVGDAIQIFAGANVDGIVTLN